MDAYPRDYLVHNYPFIVLSGLTSSASTEQIDVPILQDDYTQITSVLPLVVSDMANRLLDSLQDAGTEYVGKRRSATMEAGRIPFKMAVVGRTYRMPRRKAHRDEMLSFMSPDTDSSVSEQSLVLHSPLSPLSPGSPTFPDGLMTPLWVTKHQHMLPSAFVSFFALSAATDSDSDDDDELKNEIIRIKRSISALSPRTKYVVVLLSEQSILEAVDIDDRLASIRRATGLDPKTALFFLPPDPSPVELRAFARGILTSLQSSCVEYYRDLSKHGRRKRGRGSIPPPTLSPVWGTSQTLSNQGWNVRYDFKLGVFAEFRQEMETATRHFEAAYDLLLSADVFEPIASWSPRWNEARLLADVLSVRIIRCLLWNKQSTSAVRRWQLHRNRMKDLVDRRGKGTANYGWEAWEAIWSRVMADLIHELKLPGFAIPDDGSGSTHELIIYAGPEKSIPVGERLAPWQLLHHPGYWIALMATHLNARRRLAEAIPDEDRTSPGQSPASQVANKSYLYDTYLCPEPHREAPLPGHQGINHAAIVVEALSTAIPEFEARNQSRAVQRLKLDISREHIRCGSWAEGIRILRPLWQHMTWRREGWWDLAEEVCWGLRTCAERTGDGGSLVAAEWELMNDFFHIRSDHPYNLANCLGRLQHITAKPAVVLRAGEVTSFLSVVYVFKSPEGNVGEQLASQLVVKSRAHKRAPPVRLAEARIEYEGAFRPIVLKHRDDAEDGTTPLSLEQYIDVKFEDMSSSTSIHDIKASSSNSGSFVAGAADLELHSGQTKIFKFTSLPREAGDVQVKSVTLSMAEDLFDLDYIVPLEGKRQVGDWWANTPQGPTRRRLTRDTPGAVKILPRPPRMQIDFLDIKARYYTNERITVVLRVRNEEDEATEASLEIRILSDLDQPPSIAWSDQPAQDTDEEDQLLPGHKLGKLAPAEETGQSFSFETASQPVDYVIEAKIIYHQISDPETPVSKITTIAVPVVAPFEVTYDFSPRVHPAPWPNYFEMDDEIMAAGASAAHGIMQKWILLAMISSLTDDQLYVESVDLQTLGVTGDVLCSTSEDYDRDQLPFTMAADGTQQLPFQIEIQKLAVDDRRPAALDLALAIGWKRSDHDSVTNVTTLHVPRLVVHGGEPRVLASVQYSGEVPNLIHLDYIIENPSLRLLTFSIVMESNEDFAFYGPKAGSLQLVPISRHRLRFNLYPTVRGTWIQPQLKVIDRYFNKSLRVSATEGMKMDPKGMLVWVNAES